MSKIHADTRLEADLMIWLKAEAKENGNTLSTEIRHCIITAKIHREELRQRRVALNSLKLRGNKK